MSVHEVIFEHANIQENIEQCKVNLWEGTTFEDYPSLNAKQMGCIVGEPYVAAFMTLAHGSRVEDAIHSDHDRIIDGHKTEIKFSVAKHGWIKQDRCLNVDDFTFNHIAGGKDWERLVFMGINPAQDQCRLKEHSKQKGKRHYQQRCYFMEKEAFLHHIRKPAAQRAPFKKQQGGEAGDNDDYMVTGPKQLYQLIDLPFVKPISEW